ncbi:Adenylate kinase 3 [Spironucleus salmonicida]|uniref:Adenylate kinase 3 n=1 Tax=Spironucleus salmonicida TaxID=348837 RepID=K7R8N7_9EUKA|nr:adenylate kinase 3 [Spironucleus salmonicida]KAH0572606.1 Adenylate kinase 3 [Spironucleus salmonicida]|eukprot:EST44598.1 Adenylate kinase 3 [Spironucleus salmonicida]
MTVVHLIGYPGSGKGVVADALQQSAGFVPYSVGELMRNEIRLDTDLGKQLKFIDSGKIAPPHLAMEVLKKNVTNSDKITLDGFPRNILQAEAYLNQIGKPDLTILVNVSEKVAIQRLMNRAKNSSRKDDNEEVFQNRITAYKNETYPCVDYLRQKGCNVTEINGEISIEEMQQEAISKILNLINK